MRSCQTKKLKVYDKQGANQGAPTKGRQLRGANQGAPTYKDKIVYTYSRRKYYWCFKIRKNDVAIKFIVFQCYDSLIFGISCLLLFYQSS